MSSNSGGVASPTIPARARVVIVGGGVIGASVAYHLGRLGWSDTVLIERHQLTSGTTWHAAGLVTQMRASRAMSLVVQRSLETFREVERRTGLATGLREVGQITIATTDDRMHELVLARTRCRTYGIECELLTPSEVVAFQPLVDGRGLTGGLWFPRDGVANPTDTTLALVKGARADGVTVVEGVAATGVLREGRRVVGVRTDHGTIETRIVVNATGLWARDLAAEAGLTVPVQAVEHMYLVTDGIPGLQGDRPVIKSPDDWAYVREDAGKLLVGFFEPDARPWRGASATNRPFLQFPEAWDHLGPRMERLAERIPVLSDVGIRLFFNGPESFTPDGRMFLGEAPGLRGYFVAAGLNSIGLLAGPGVGAVLADRIAGIRPTIDASETDVRRAVPFQAGRRYLRERAQEVPGALYRIGYPGRQFESARGIRRTPLHQRTAAAGACFGELAGWERPLWYGEAGETTVDDLGFDRTRAFERSRLEHLAVRGAVGLFDLSTMAKVRVDGPGALGLLQGLSTADIDVGVDRTVYTQWLNVHGGIEADLTVTRTAPNDFLVQTATATLGQVRDLLEHAADVATGVHVADVTVASALLALMGPEARTLLGRVTDADLAGDAFPYGASREIDLGRVRARATRISYVGELGWELLVTADMAADAFDTLVAAGADLGLRLAGYRALDSLRLEKGFRDWGHDIGPLDSPIQAGLGSIVAWDKADPFLGRDALVAERGIEGARRLVGVRLADPEPLLDHDEPLWRRGEIVGHLASGAYGHTLGCAVGLAWLAPADGRVSNDVLDDDAFEVEIGGVRHRAVLSRRPFYDPEGRRPRS